MERIRLRSVDEAFMNYVADSWHLHGENKYLSYTLRDVTDPKVHEEVDFEATVRNVEAKIESIRRPPDLA